MANLSLAKWARYEPSIPGNADLPVAERFFLEVASGLTVVRFQEMLDALRAATTPAGIAAALDGVVRLGTVPLTLDGEEIRTAADYVEQLLEQRGVPLFAELQERLGHWNSYGGTREVFFERPSGGIASTPGPSTDPGSVQTAAP